MIGVALAILGPLLAAAAILALRRGGAALALFGSAAGLAGSLYALAGVAGGGRYSATLPGLPGLPLRLVAEPVTAVASAVVGVVGLLVVVYAVGYMKEEAGQARFFGQMSLFVGAMQTLVLAGDWVLLLAAWEIIGLCSYLLIGFHYERRDAARSAVRAFLYTRTADLGLYVAVFVLISQTGTSEISRTLELGGPVATFAGLALLVAVAGKSAQVPLQGWLQDAMTGPTPVSALLHSATLVAAGALLLVRVSPMLTPAAQLATGILGGVTAVVAGVIAVSGRDLKRLLAASTSSQYGFMLLAVGAGAPAAALFHLVAHAAMKSSLFLGAGVFQRARSSTAFADLGGVGRERLPVYLGFVVAGLALAGVPPLSGFFSKEAVVAATLHSPSAPVLAPLALVGALLTAVYVARALRLLWRGEGEDKSVPGARWMWAGLAALVVLAAALGVAKAPLTGLLGREIPFGFLAALLGLALALAGLVLGWLVPAGTLLGPLRGAAERGFRVLGGFDGLVARPALALALTADAVDRGLHAGVLGAGRLSLSVANVARATDEHGIDRLIAGLVRGMRRLGRRARRMQTGLVHRELMLAAFGVAVILISLSLFALLQPGSNPLP
ncbi:NADH-quinone oxidoreductase subunit 5 family protein [Rubrobacter aplysinae]|uniref:NADH-quinone oxidoreductase subunit 5 family protein n=1 Tax=Rubrobacter aplysinae TaxID=909625 RepID=UPI00064C2991|nr:NADH-quinone oxidoreductase subunit L [Rubrobacter aplysinae]